MKFNKNLMLCVLLGMLIACCKPSVEESIHQKIKHDTDEIFDQLVQLRRDFHQYPELAGNEERTSNIIAAYLSNLGLEVKTGFSGNAVLGILKGDKEGKHIAWRADMDALLSNYLDQVSYSSKVAGVQHGCGHDVHMAVGLGIATVLAKNKENVHGTIYFVFQPEEETFVGAKNIVHSSLFSKINLDEIYAMHVTALPIGDIIVKPLELYAYQKRIQLTFKNTLLKEEAATLFAEIRNKILRKKDGANPWEIPMAFDATFGLKNHHTIFKDYLFLEESFVVEYDEQQLFLKAYLYETDSSNLQHLLPKIEAIIEESIHKEKFIAASFIQENPTVLNDETLTNQAIHTLNQVYGNNTVKMAYGQIPYFNDDFYYFQQKTPGVYFLLGGSNTEKGINAMNHAPNFEVDEECIRTAVSAFSSLLLERTYKESY